MLSWFEIVAVLLVLTAGLGWFNRRFLDLPNAVGLVTSGLAVAGLGLLAQWLAPGSDLHGIVADTIHQVDFSAVVMNGMLAFLLFAGAYDVDLGRLRARAWPVFALAVIGTLTSTAIVGAAVWAVAQLLATPLAPVWCFLFGAVISPTDPVAVLSALRSAAVPETVETELQGEALLNDGVAVVLVTVLTGFAAGANDRIGWAEIGTIGLREVAGGLMLGLVCGHVAFRAIRAIDDFRIEVLITLALVSGTYALAQRLGASGPLAVVAAGLLVGDRGPRLALSERSRRYVSGLWTLINEVLNSILFLLIGLEIFVLRFADVGLGLALAAIPIVVAARALSVAAPLLVLPFRGMLSSRNIPLLTWAGIRGGVSIALALALPDRPEKSVVLAATYAVVIFSIVVQGLTLGRLARRYETSEESR